MRTGAAPADQSAQAGVAHLAPRSAFCFLSLRAVRLERPCPRRFARAHSTRQRSHAPGRGQRTRTHRKAERLSKAHGLWTQSRPLIGTIGERYLRERPRLRRPVAGNPALSPGARCARPGHAGSIWHCRPNRNPAGSTSSRDAMRGVHITRLAPDGSGKAGTDARQDHGGHCRRARRSCWRRRTIYWARHHRRHRGRAVRARRYRLRRMGRRRCLVSPGACGSHPALCRVHHDPCPTATRTANATPPSSPAD